MPKPGEHHAKLDALAGRWRGQERIHPTAWDPVGGEAEAESEGWMDLDGFCLIMDYTQRRNGKVSYRGHGIFGWDFRADVVRTSSAEMVILRFNSYPVRNSHTSGDIYMADEVDKRDDFSDDESPKPQQINYADIPDLMPLLPVRDVVIFSYMILPLMVGREKSIRAVEKALEKDRLIFLCTQKHSGEEDPGPEDIFTIGTVAMVVKMLKLPDGRVKILVQGLEIGRASCRERV